MPVAGRLIVGFDTVATAGHVVARAARHTQLRRERRR
jgi:hypothetical protein